MLFYLILLYATLYFFVPLAVGGTMLLFAGTSSSRAVKVVGWGLVLLGCWGAVNGVPAWYQRFKFQQETGEYFKARCKAAAVMELPPGRLSADGLVWLLSGDARASPLSGRDLPEDFVNPGLGRYRIIQYQNDKNSGFSESAWSDKSMPGRMDIARRMIQQPSLPYELRTRSITTNEDRRARVEGVETTITDAVTQQVVARRVAFSQRSSNGSYDMFDSCPSGVFKEANCDVNGCSVIPFVTSAIKPILPPDHKKIFHLSRGGGNQSSNCAFEINVGPGVSLEQLEWWGDGRPGWEDLHLRIRGTADDLVCGEFLWGGGNFQPVIRLADGGRFPAEELRGLFKRQKEKQGQPMPLPKR